MCFNVKTFVKMVKNLSLTATLGHIPRVQKPGPRPTALAWLRLSKTSGQAKAHPRPKVRPGLAWPGLARLLASGRSRHITSRVCRFQRVVSLAPRLSGAQTGGLVASRFV